MSIFQGSIESIDDLNAIDQQSWDSNNGLAIFKHSTRCGISRMVLKQLESDWKQLPNPVSIYYLDLLAHRDVSNEIAKRYGIEHQSPQLIVIKDGSSIWSGSHYEASVDEMQEGCYA